MKGKRCFLAGVLLVGVLAASSVRAQNKTTSTDVLTKEECKDNAPIDDFATDDRIISCVRGASESCCEAMNELLGEESPVHYCTCSSGVLEDVLDEAVPMFAKDIIHTRIAECELPVAGEERCKGLYDDSDFDAKAAAANGTCVDEYPPDVDTRYTCEDQAGFGKCDEGWMDGYCLLSCEKCEAEEAASAGEEPEDEGASEGSAAEGDEILVAEEGEVLENGTLVLSNCTDEKSPSDNSNHDCAKQKDFGKCDEGWMDGYCLLSCGKCVKPVARQIASAASVPKGKANATEEVGAPSAGDEISGNSTATEQACADEYPPNVDTQFTCEDQASFGNCDDDWMDGYCLLSCDKCGTTTEDGENSISS
ncbi:hypothetical protein HOP50_17g80720 [Chloropicon primus]|uniref:ShKT domain-containing protein n=1 Tax=Chloropicon primus TaxID=1764295 RepID=A0A5B8N131_9CHLO|nr:hypothetical protein A3770_17p80480 [Chloropicon primus]UPR04727.1 hypothetical protein HOP50_17g80720 [Chloropicon primus]|eukprot:QDZ25530.1 hypothetical protein A3770_17p80480 [Chloropicon primus]